ncbi:ion channel [Bradyrhizobium sp. LA2.1]|uniref:ion channel n=1 Tax=Bradyrhizobium sp. LA2.1 TaxID=3156376 RepID=UPI003395FEE9
MANQDFFRLGGNPTDIDQDQFFLLTTKRGTISSKIYRPPTLISPREPQRALVDNCQFEDFSFSKTLIDNIEFKKCTFLRCLFIGTRIKRCRFTECSFIDTNTYRIEFEDTYINPLSFQQCLDPSRYQNIGVYLYQELLNNSRRQSQPDFTQDALFLFRRWTRYQEVYRLKAASDWRTRARLAKAICLNFVEDILLGFGVRVGSFCRTALASAVLLAFANYVFAQELGLSLAVKDGTASFWDALYFTIITLTTIGYGDIAPSTHLGRIAVAAEGMLGFLLFAILASMIYRKILP